MPRAIVLLVSVIALLFSAGVVSADEAIGSAAPAGFVLAQQGPDRNCQTFRTCRYTKGGVYRGCLSSYSCQTCRFVKSDCMINGARGQCQRLVCTYGATS